MKISVITPSFNQGAYIERTIESVLGQSGDFDLEYIVLDAGSTDGTLDILKRYESQLSWKSEPDNGQSDAINKGFRMASGDLLAWLNSDDTYCEGALAAVAEEYMKKPFEWCFGNCTVIDENDREIRKPVTRYKANQGSKYSTSRLLRRDFISQPATFFSGTAYQTIGDIAEDLVYSMDYDYWLRLGKRWQPRHIPSYLASFRWHGESKNGSAYRVAAWETYCTAKRHAAGSHSMDLFLHYCHYHLLTIVYRFI